MSEGEISQQGVQVLQDRKSFKISSRENKVAHGWAQADGRDGCRIWNFAFNLGEINKHMQDLTAEFEELFDPYLPIASKLKIKPGLGVSGAKVKRPSCKDN